jgi:hypothetical protein
MEVSIVTQLERRCVAEDRHVAVKFTGSKRSAMIEEWKDLSTRLGYSICFM